MTAGLDLKTLLACLFFGNLFTVLLILAYWPSYPKEKPPPLFLIAKILQLAILQLLLLEEIHDFPLVPPSIILLSVAAGTAEILALLKKLEADSERMKQRYYALAGISAVGLLLPYLLHPDVPRLIAASALTGAILLLYPAYLLSWKVRKTPLQEITGMLYGVAILSLLSKAGRLDCSGEGTAWSNT
ncbi:hypothetical protein MKX42_08325 [Paenibacillus sp. FSL R7-0204]|uniref:hypothetical protein n=1 Tax=Paenibacillus sp. FSL R7-0204 TaxID=2921675 RepID=UPI0030FA2D27